MLMSISAKLSHEKPKEFRGKPLNDSLINRESKVVWQNFDPNKASIELLTDLGLKPWIAERLINYREKVKPFEEPLELLKVYDIDSNWVEQALPYINIEKSFEEFAEGEQRNQIPKKRNEDYEKVLVIELNSADTADLKSIPGIGSYYAKQIVELKENLGGFSSFEQLLEIYKIRDQTLDNLNRYTTIDTSLIKRININKCDLKQLGRHPYLTWQQARIIIAYRDQHGDFNSIEEILKTEVIPDSVYVKIAPYLSIE